jgi:hypothetical protein
MSTSYLLLLSRYVEVTFVLTVKLELEFINVES